MKNVMKKACMVILLLCMCLTSLYISPNGVIKVSAATTYAIRYNANGGSNAPATQNKVQGQALKLTTQRPTRTGYTFLGWSTNSKATSPTYQPGGTYTANAAATLYAVWKVQTYTISYNANGGSGAPASQTKSFGVSLTLSSQKPTRSGFSFLGWSTSSTATSATYSAGATYSSNSSTTLYAVWKTLSYTIKYNANGGSGAPTNQTKLGGQTLTLSSVQPTRTGYSFVGWATSSTATTSTYLPGASYTNNASVTLYAVWKIKTFTVSYNANGGSGAPASQTKSYNVALTISATKPTRTGYNFVGWATSSSSTSAQYQAGGSYTSNANITLYAVWSTKTYKVSYNANGGSGAPSAQTKTHGTAITLSSQKPTRTGYTFLGWSTSSTATAATYASGASYTNNADITLYAVWKAQTYTISYNANGGSGAPSSQTKTYGVAITLSSQKPTRTGYSFLGWSSSSTATAAKYASGASYTGNATITLYAVWSKDIVYSDVVKNYFTCMDYTIDAFAEYANKTDEQGKKNVKVQFYLYALGKDIGSTGLFNMGIDGSIGSKTSAVLESTVGTTNIDDAIKLLKDKLAPILEARNTEWNAIVQNSGSLLSKTAYTLEDPKYLVIFKDADETEVDPIFQGRLANFAKAHKIPVLVSDGFRSYELQAQRYKESGGVQAADGTWSGGNGNAAKPGSSWHEFGEAVDIASLGITCTNYIKNDLYGATDATQNQTELIKYGIFKPLTSGNGKSVTENWHIQPYSETEGVTGQQRIAYYEAFSGKTYKGK